MRGWLGVILGLLLAPAAVGDEAADQLFQAGWSHFMGVGAAQDRAEAARWFRMAAEQGDARAQYWLGLMLAAGVGIPAEPEAARDWLGKASDQGHPGAADALPLVGLARVGPATPERAAVAEPLPAPGSPELARAVQSHLMALGYDPGYIDGIVGRLTIAAVRAYQRDHGQDPDGEVDQALLRELRGQLAAGGAGR